MQRSLSWGERGRWSAPAPMMVLERLKMDAGMLDPLSTLVGESISGLAVVSTSTSTSTLQQAQWKDRQLSFWVQGPDDGHATTGVLLQCFSWTAEPHSAGAVLSSRGCSMSSCSDCCCARRRAACSTSSASSASVLAALPMKGMGNAVTVSCKPLTLSQRTVRMVTARRSTLNWFAAL